MKLVTFDNGGDENRVGVLTKGDTGVIDLTGACGAAVPWFTSMLALIEGGDAALEHARDVVRKTPASAVLPLDAVTLRTPVPAPPQIRDFLCFEEHLKRACDAIRRTRAAQEPDPEAALKEFEAKGLFRVPDVWYRQPIFYKANRFTVIGTDEDVIWPAYSEALDYELEFGAFLKGDAKDIPRERAREHIFGYAIFNDISARDEQSIEMAGLLGPGKGKDFDTGNVIGPCIVTADEIDPYNLTMVARVNGEEWSRGSTSTMHWKFEDLIAHTSRSETLHAGEFFGSGTVGGGCGLELGRYLSPGDVVELEVEGIGVLRNRVVRAG